jgi:hypothetical protein
MTAHERGNMTTGAGMRVIAMLTLMAALAAVAMLGGRSPLGPASAQASQLPPPAYAYCDPKDASQPFLVFGDLESYVPVFNGGFEDGLTGWTVEGKGDATIVPSINPDGTLGNALELGQGTKVLSPPICFDETRPHSRMFVRKTEEKSSMSVDIHYARYPRGKPGRMKLDDFGRDDPVLPTWGPSPRLLALGGLKKLVMPDSNGQRWYQYEVSVKGGTWQIDDLFVDPRIRG